MPLAASDGDPGGGSGSASSTEGRVLWVRHPADLARLVLAAVVWLVAVGLSSGYPEDARGLSTRVVLLVDGLPDGLARAFVGLVQLAALVLPIAALALVRRGRWRELALAAGAAATTAVLAALTNGELADTVPTAVIDEAERPSWVTGAGFPSATYLAAAAAAAAVLTPSLPRRWWRVVWASVGVIAAARVVAAVETPIGLVCAVAAGVGVGSLVTYVAKAPLRWPPAAAIAEALRDAGLPVATARATDLRHRHGPTYEVDGTGGERWFVKAVGADERDAELLTRAVRALRAASPDDRPALGATETTRFEALNLVLADRAGASVPGLVAVSEVPDHGAVVVMDRLDGRPLDEVEDVPVEVLEAAFAQLAALHRARVAHGWVTDHHVLVGAGGGRDGGVHLLDLRWATPAATDLQLARDLAEALVAAAGRVGVERAVAAARTAFDAEQLAAALPLVQPLAVAPEARAAARRDKALLPALRDEVQRVAGVESYEMAKLERLSPRKVLVFAGTLVLANLLLSMFGDVDEIWAAMQDADLSYLPLVVLAAMLGFPASAISLMGAVNVRLAFARTTKVMFAQSFLNRFTPANAGGMALRTRYLQRSGVPLVSAASAVALTSAASGVMQVLVAITFFTWAGRGDEADVGFSLPSGHVILVVVVAVLALLGIAYATAFGRKLLADLRLNLATIVGDLRTLGRQPTKLVMLFGGAVLSKLLLILMYFWTLQAFGIHLGLGVVGAIYITATTVASAAPTPGGVGAIEAALTAGLTGLGVEAGEAAAVVLVFRFLSYWLPVLPCWLALTWMQRNGEV